MFLLGVSGAIWIRRWASLVSAMALLALVSILILQGSPVTTDGHEVSLWAGVIALIAAFWVFTVQMLACRVGFGPRAKRQPAIRKAAASGPRRYGSRRAIGASTRGALQMGVAIGVAFAAGRLIWPSHWTWTVLTAFIVCSGARGRGDALHKGALRLLGAAGGTILATVIAGSFAPLDRMTVVIIFAVLALRSWLRPLSYAYWAGCVTAVLSLLYSYFGESASSLLQTRLEAIALGALIAISSCWLVLPVRNTDVLRRRLANLLATLSEVLAPGPIDPTTLEHQRARFDESVRQLEQLTPSLTAAQRLPMGRRRASDGLQAIDAVRRAVAPAHSLISCREHDGDTSPALARMRSATAANVAVARRQIARLPPGEYRPLPTALTTDDRAGDEAMRSLAQIDGAIAKLARNPTTLPPARHDPAGSNSLCTAR